MVIKIGTGKSKVKKVLQSQKKLERKGQISQRNKYVYEPEIEKLKQLAKEHRKDPVKIYDNIKWVDSADASYRRFRENHLVPELQKQLRYLFSGAEHPLQEIKKISDYCSSKKSKQPYFSLERAFDLALKHYMKDQRHRRMANEICKIVIDTAEPIKKWSGLLHDIIFNEVYVPREVKLMYESITAQIARAEAGIDAKREMTDRVQFFFQREGD